MKIKKVIYNFLPYLVCIITSYIFFITSKKLESDYKNVIQGLSGAFISIPLLYIIYELAKKFSQKKLNKELFEYAKMQIDSEILSIINQIMKIVFPYNKISSSFKAINEFLSQKQNQIISILKNEKYLDELAKLIIEIIECINEWLDLTGREFLFNSEMFKININENKNNYSD